MEATISPEAGSIPEGSTGPGGILGPEVSITRDRDDRARPRTTKTQRHEEEFF